MFYTRVVSFLLHTRSLFPCVLLLHDVMRAPHPMHTLHADGLHARVLFCHTRLLFLLVGMLHNAMRAPHPLCYIHADGLHARGFVFVTRARFFVVVVLLHNAM